MTPATQKQMDFAVRLGKEVAGLDLNKEGQTALDTVRGLWGRATLDRKMMSGIIEELLTLKRSTPAKVEPVTGELEGMHRLDGEIYKVQRAVHGSGNLYAKHLVLSDQGCSLGCGHVACGHDDPTRYSVTFTYAPGVIYRLSEDSRMSLDEAKEFGSLYGTCMVCGRTLTNEESIEAGIGPVCAQRF